MSTEVVQVMEQAGPYVTAALAAYGGAVLHRAEDAAVEATANRGRRVLQAVWRRCSPGGRTQLEEAVQGVAEEPDNPDAQAVLRQQVRRALREDTELLREITELLPVSHSTNVTASGNRSIAAKGISGIAITGDHSSVRK
ncbi:hypothetical protein [Streptomyces beigongshangae]|uniref:hypothetical protein n=1 Tax=Streptomyces beigongshangae TaxID=2841597 RepID=UPI001C86283D|nr:hypothetical protein [Streptomyces sp. REN17]